MAWNNQLSTNRADTNTAEFDSIAGEVAKTCGISNCMLLRYWGSAIIRSTVHAAISVFSDRCVGYRKYDSGATPPLKACRPSNML